jgi:hypothetical protein
MFLEKILKMLLKEKSYKVAEFIYSYEKMKDEIY